MRRTLRASRQTTMLLEPLEGRQLFAVTLGTNLVLNPGAESSAGATTTSQFLTPSKWTVGDGGSDSG